MTLITVKDLMNKLQEFPSDANLSAVVKLNGFDKSTGQYEWVKLLDVDWDPADDGEVSIIVAYHTNETDPLQFYAREAKLD